MKTSKLPLILIVAIAVLTPLLSTAMFYLWQPAVNTHKYRFIRQINLEKRQRVLARFVMNAEKPAKVNPARR